MKKGRYELTPIGGITLLVLVLVIIGGLIFGGYKMGIIKPSSKPKPSESVSSDIGNKVNTTEQNSSVPTSAVTENTTQEAPKTTSNKSDTINLSLDEWIGWKSIIDANGGLTTQPDSIYDKLGIKVTINVINDATQSSNALIKGDLNGAGYTINRMAFLSKKFTDSGVDIIMPYVTNYSNGGDGIIATTEFNTVSDLVNAKIGIPQFSEAQTLVMWLLNESDLTDEQRENIVSNFVYFDTPDEVAKAFFAGHVDVAATWEPYLTQAKTTSNCHVLFSTAASRNLVMDGIVFRRDFAEANPELIQKFIDGSLQARDMYMTEFGPIKDVMPMFSGCSDDEIIESAVNADLTTWKDNMTLLTDTAKTIYYDMCSIWGSIGEQVNANLVDTAFDTSYMEALKDTYELSVTTQATPVNRKTVVKVTDENKDEIVNTSALLEKKVTINFDAQTCNFMNNTEASEQLQEFVDIAKTLDGAIIQIEGNVASSQTTEENKQLSKDRAETVKKFFVLNGIDGQRIFTVGNGADKPVMDNYNPDGTLSKEGTDANRRTDIYFKTVELAVP